MVLLVHLDMTFGTFGTLIVVIGHLQMTFGGHLRQQFFLDFWGSLSQFWPTKKCKFGALDTSKWVFGDILDKTNIFRRFVHLFSFVGSFTPQKTQFWSLETSKWLWSKNFYLKMLTFFTTTMGIFEHIPKYANFANFGHGRHSGGNLSKIAVFCQLQKCKALGFKATNG